MPPFAEHVIGIPPAAPLASAVERRILAAGSLRLGVVAVLSDQQVRDAPDIDVGNHFVLRASARHRTRRIIGQCCSTLPTHRRAHPRTDRLGARCPGSRYSAAARTGCRGM
jgi:hypothetical protein